MLGKIAKMFLDIFLVFGKFVNETVFCIGTAFLWIHILQTMNMGDNFTNIDFFIDDVQPNYIDFSLMGPFDIVFYKFTFFDMS